MLVDGRWNGDWQPLQAKDAKGGFVRQASSFRNWVTPDGRPGPTGEGGFAAEPGRYHLYVALTCPWASRALIARRLKGLEGVVAVTVVDPVMTGQGWRFGDYPGSAPISSTARPICTRSTRAPIRITPAARPCRRCGTGRADDRQQRIGRHRQDVQRRLRRARRTPLDLYPSDIASEIDALNDQMYDGLNNGVYRAGFAATQVAYEDAFKQVFATLDALEARLVDGRRFLFGDRFTESDIRAFVTLVRFDVAYHGVFKCNRKRIVDYPALQAYLCACSTGTGFARRCRSTTSSAAIIRSSRSTPTASRRSGRTFRD